jgi:uncharacterized membrane protein
LLVFLLHGCDVMPSDEGMPLMLAIIASGVTVGLLGAVMVWSGGHHPLAIGLAYTLTGMIGVLGSATLVAAKANVVHDPRN